MRLWTRQTVDDNVDYRTAVWAFYQYYPSEAAVVLSTVLFAITTFVHLYQLFRHRTWFFIPFVVGGSFEWVGYIGRILSSQKTLLLLLAPVLFAASIYMMLGRIVIFLDAEQFCVFRKKWLSKFFVSGDISSFTVQAAGGGAMASGSLSLVHNGEKIVTAGLVIQILFEFFIITCAIFHMCVDKFPTERSLESGSSWRKHLAILYTANILIMIRPVFRLIEYAMGNNGYLLRREAFLHVFDGLLILVVMILFNTVHPSGMIQSRRKGVELSHNV
ncbi:RTA1 like protein-domain-containing protein [Aspergillus falconensis]